MAYREQPELSLLAFLTALRKAAQALPSGEIIERLLKYGETLPVEQRAAFLQRFAGFQADVGTPPAAYTSDESLAEDVDAFVDRVKSQSYVEGSDWDYQSDDLVTWGDESWADEMADLFARVDQAFFAGDFATAAAAYPKLLKLFALPDETGEGYFPGESDPVEMVGINAQETVARYLRSLLGNNDAWDIDTFVDELIELSGQLYQTFSLKTILEASPQPFSQTGPFLLELEPILSEHRKQSPGYGVPDWGLLLREAVLLQGGTDGLGTLAHAQGATMPEAYYEWILALRREGRDDEALRATRKAVEKVKIPQAKGVLANALVTLLDERGEHEGALQGAQLAWRSYPTLFNLKVYLAYSQPDLAEMLTRIDTEYTLVQHGDITFSRLEGGGNATRILIQALAGDYDRIATEARTSKGVGWSSPEHIGYSAYAALLLAATEPPTLPPASSHLANLVRLLEDRAKSGGLETIMPSAVSEQSAVDIPALLIARLAVLSTRQARQSAYREAAKQVALRRVEDIVSNQHRNAYDRAAQIAVAYAEMLKLSGHPGDATAIPKELVARFPRHSAFRAELQTAWRSSSVVRGMAW